MSSGTSSSGPKMNRTVAFTDSAASGRSSSSRAATALTAFEGHKAVGEDEVRRVALLALRHRLRKDPLETQDDEAKIERALSEVLG